MPHEVVQTLCCPLPASPSLSSWEGHFPGAMSPPSSFESLDFGHDGGRGVPAHCHPREGCGAMLLPCPVPPPQVDHPGLSDHSQDVLAVVPTIWGGWSLARWPKAAEDPKQCMRVESCHILLLNPSHCHRYCLGSGLITNTMGLASATPRSWHPLQVCGAGWGVGWEEKGR